MRKEAYEELKPMVGLEIHQQLDTKHKLFCNCPTTMREKTPLTTIERRLRPVQSELGETDVAAQFEYLRNRSFCYQVFSGESCLVETDCEPPHELNPEALEIALQIALLLNCRIPDEIHTMRKIVIDGSNTSGFQRTCIVGLGGFLEYKGRRIEISTIALEEDAAAIVSEERGKVTYRLNRLGVPLVEIGTGPIVGHTPQEIQEIAYSIGMICRATDKVKREIGAIRQDVNISVRGGARVEIKGVQELGLISKVVEREVQRQLALIEIKKELARRGAGRVEKEFVDVTEAFSGTGSQIVSKGLAKGKRVLAVNLPKFAGLVGRELQPGRRLGTELADWAKLYGKVGGILHTDELPAYGISREEVERIRRATGASEDDAVVIVVDTREKARTALAAVVDRANQAIEGVPEETRRALPDGNTEFMRPLPGAGRMYPETDIPPIPIREDRLKTLRESLPELPERKKERFMKEYGLGEEMAGRLSLSEKAGLFERLARGSGASPKLIATTLEETMVSLRREGIEVERVPESFLLDMFNLISNGKLAKEAIPEVLAEGSKGKDIQEVLKKLGLRAPGEEELKRFVREVTLANRKLIEERGEAAMKPLMGILMKHLRGKVDGKVVNEALTHEIRKMLRKE